MRRIGWWARLLNRVGWRKDTIVCMHQDDTWCWPEHLGAQTKGACSQCGGPIYFEKQNSVFRKVCNRCVVQREEE
jgi:hypothetical protein